ncbi:putative MFS transporter [Bacillus sp. TS-2]|nr:putative MFS transporter [Bacillus sp. TS-2]
MSRLQDKPKSLWKNKSFMLVWFSQTFYEFSGALGTFCLSIIIYEQTGSPLALGSMWLLYFIPSLVLQLFIGPFIDRWSRKYILIFSQWLKGFLYCLLLGLIMLEGSWIWSIFFIQVMVGLIAPLYAPACQALLPTIVKEEQLKEANSKLDGSIRLMVFIAPIGGGAIIQYIDTSILILLIALLSIFSGYLLIFIKEATFIYLQKKRWVDDFREGMSLFFKQKAMVWLAIFLSFVQFGVGVTMVISLPYVTTILGANYHQYGYFVASFPLGYVLGSFICHYMRIKSYRKAMMGSLFIGGLTFAILTINHSVYVAFLTEAIAGVAMAIFNIHNLSLFQKLVPNSVLGKMASVRLFFIRFSIPLGVVVATLSAEVIGVRYLYLFIGVMICTVSVIGLILPYFRFLDDIKEKDETIPHLETKKSLNT